MGTANKQIATQSNVALKRINPGYTGTMCVTKSDITPIEFLEAKNRTSNTSASFNAINSYFGWNDDIVMSVRHGSVSTNDTITNSDCYYSNGEISCISNDYISPNTSTLTYVEYGSTWPGTAAQAKYYAISKRTFTVPIGQSINLNYEFYLYGAQSSSIGGDVTTITPNNYSWKIGIIITDSSDTYVISTLTPGSTYGYSYTGTLTFTSNYSSINVYVITPYIYMSYYPRSTYYYNGFKINSSMTLVYNESYYDQTYKCVQYQDINHPTDKTFTVYYGIWNNKSSNAQLDKVYAQIKKTTESSWTTIGTKSVGNVNKSTTGSFTCTLPTNFDPTAQYDFRMCCGETRYNQDWYYRWGSQSSVTASGYSWTYVGSVKTGLCNTDAGLNQNSQYAVLYNYNYPSSWTAHRGRSTSNAAIFCIE